MFPLHSDQLPTSTDELARILEHSLREIIQVQNQIVTLREKAFPELAELRINLDGAQLRSSAARPSAVSGRTTPAYRVENLEVSARGMAVDNMPLDLAIRATNVHFHQGRDRAGTLILVLQHADAGKIDLSVAKPDLEKLIGVMAKREAAKHGVIVENVTLMLRSPGPCILEGMVQFRARKLFLSGVIRIAGKVDIDERLTAKISGLGCSGDGAIGTLACNILRSHLQRLDGREFNLAALPLGDIALHDVELVAAEKVALRAQFGSTA